VRKHPTDLHLEALLLDQSDEGREVLFHLCECERCRQRFRSRPLRQPVDEVDVVPPPPRLSGPVSALRSALVQEGIEAPEQIHREALAALSFLRQAIEAEQASLGLIRAVAEFLRRARHCPELRFEAPGGG
jgi:hypothetical protein